MLTSINGGKDSLIWIDLKEIISLKENIIVGTEDLQEMQLHYIGMLLILIFMVTKQIKEKNCREKVPPAFDRTLLFGATWAILGASHLADFVRHLGPSWPPRGSQNPPFWHQVAPKSQKMSPRMRHQTMYEILIEI